MDIWDLPAREKDAVEPYVLTKPEGQNILTSLGPPIDPARDPKISVSLRPYLCFMRDEINLANKAFIMVRRMALKKLIEDDYNLYMKELRKYDAAITRTQP